METAPPSAAEDGAGSGPSSPPAPLPEIPKDMLPVPGGTFVMGADGKAEFIHRGHRAMTRRL